MLNALLCLYFNIAFNHFDVNQLINLACPLFVFSNHFGVRLLIVNY